MFSKIQILPQIFFPELFGPKHFRNGFHDNSARTDCSKDMWIPILKGLKHLNTVLQSSRNWGLGLDITILACMLVRPLRRGCVILLSMKLGRMEGWNDGKITF